MFGRRFGLIAVAALSLMFLPGLSGVSFGQQKSSAGDTVPREEYEQMRKDMKVMQQRLDAMEEREATKQAVKEDSNSRSGSSGGETGVTFELRDTSGPNWERSAKWEDVNFRMEDLGLRLVHSQDFDLYMGLASVGRFQWLDQQDVSTNGKKAADIDPSFQTPWGDLAFLADIDHGKMEVYFDLYISSRPHAAQMYGNEGYILIREIPDDAPVSRFLNDHLFKYVNVKAGDFEIDFGDHRFRRSDNAWVQHNLLIGNGVVDPDVEEIGMEIYSKPQSINWLVGITSGTTSENFNEGRGIASVHGKVWKDLREDLRASVSAYYVDHSDNPADTASGGTKGALFTGQRSGGSYGAVWAKGDGPGQLLLGQDQEVTAVQGDLTYTPRPWEFYGNVGWMQDADTNGSATGTPRDSWTYGTGEIAYFFTPRLYAAGRYSLAVPNELSSHDSGGLVQRVQIGGGYWVTKYMLAKIEGVYQKYTGFDVEDGTVSGVDAANDPSFYGAVFEMSFQF